MLRAADALDLTGRVLEGIAYKYNKPSRVSDDNWKSSYYEEIVSGADKKTLKERKEFPVLRLHRESERIGTAEYFHSDNEDALMFRATLEPNNPIADEVLEDESWRDVSAGGEFIRSAFRHTDYHGRITQRVELKLNELSLAPAGTGLHKDAQVLMRRADDLAIVKAELAYIRHKRLRLELGL